MSDNRLKSLADRIERLMDERDGIQGDIRDIYAEAKSAGYVPKVLRKAITRKRMDPDKRSEEDTILDLYEGALTPTMRKAVAMAANGASAREIETETGIDQATVARSVSLNKKSETPKPEDGDDGIKESPVPTGGPTAVRNEGGDHDAGHLSDSRRHQSSEYSTDGSLAAGVAAQADGGGDGVRPRGVLAPEPEVARVAPPASCADEAPATPFLGDDPGPTLDFLRGPSPANRRVA